jgi:hypothetical protein
MITTRSGKQPVTRAGELAMRRRLSVSFVLFVDVVLAGIAPALADVDDYRLLSVTRVSGNAARLDWSPDGEWLAVDKRGEDGLYDVYLMRPDGSDLRCLTCPDAGADPSLPSDRQIGQPAFHPSGEWLAIQVEKQRHKDDTRHPSPGAGTYQDLWVMRLSDRRCYQLTHVSDGIGSGTPVGGTLHPVFSHDGGRILWTDMQDYGIGLGLLGDWQLALAEFVVDPEPRLTARVHFNPGESGLWYESHGFGPDDTWIYFSGNTAGTWELYADINTMVLAEAPAVTRLTRSAGPQLNEKGHYDEHAHLSPRFDVMAWLRSVSGQAEVWLANADGTGGVQLTHFSDSGHPDHELVRGLKSVPSDNAWNPNPPAGTQQLAVYVQVDFDLLRNRSTYDELYLLQFEVAGSTNPDTGSPNAQADAGSGSGDAGTEQERIADGGSSMARTPFIAIADAGPSSTEKRVRSGRSRGGCRLGPAPEEVPWLWLLALLCFVRHLPWYAPSRNGIVSRRRPLGYQNDHRPCCWPTLSSPSSIFFPLRYLSW